MGKGWNGLGCVYWVDGRKSERVGEKVAGNGWLGSGWVDKEVKGAGGWSGWFGFMWQEGLRE